MVVQLTGSVTPKPPGKKVAHCTLPARRRISRPPQLPGNPCWKAATPVISSLKTASTSCSPELCPSVWCSFVLLSVVRHVAAHPSNCNSEKPTGTVAGELHGRSTAAAARSTNSGTGAHRHFRRYQSDGRTASVRWHRSLYSRSPEGSAGRPS